MTGKVENGQKVQFDHPSNEGAYAGFVRREDSATLAYRKQAHKNLPKEGIELSLGDETWRIVTVKVEANGNLATLGLSLKKN